jgi:hypothetical protein
VEASRESCSVLAIKGGSSSIRFSRFDESEPLRRLLDGKVDRVGLSGANFTIKDSTGLSQDSRTIDPADHHSAVAFLLDWLETQQMCPSIKAVGHSAGTTRSGSPLERRIDRRSVNRRARCAAADPKAHLNFPDMQRRRRLIDRVAAHTLGAIEDVSTVFPRDYPERIRADNAQVWRAICSSSCEGRTCTAQRVAGSLIGFSPDRFRAESRVTPSQVKPPQIATRASISFSPIPPVNTIISAPPSTAIIAATCLRTE